MKIQSLSSSLPSSQWSYRVLFFNSRRRKRVSSMSITSAGTSTNDFVRPTMRRVVAAEPRSEMKFMKNVCFRQFHFTQRGLVPPINICSFGFLVESEKQVWHPSLMCLTRSVFYYSEVWRIHSVYSNAHNIETAEGHLGRSITLTHLTSLGETNGVIVTLMWPE